MKNKYIILYVLMFLPMVITLLVLPAFPDVIPAH